MTISRKSYALLAATSLIVLASVRSVPAAFRSISSNPSLQIDFTILDSSGNPWIGDIEVGLEFDDGRSQYAFEVDLDANGVGSHVVELLTADAESGKFENITISPLSSPIAIYQKNQFYMTPAEGLSCYLEYLPFEIEEGSISITGSLSEPPQYGTIHVNSPIGPGYYLEIHALQSGVLTTQAARLTESTKRLRPVQGANSVFSWDTTPGARAELYNPAGDLVASGAFRRGGSVALDVRPIYTTQFFIDRVKYPDAWVVVAFDPTGYSPTIDSDIDTKLKMLARRSSGLWAETVTGSEISPNRSRFASTSYELWSRALDSGGNYTHTVSEVIARPPGPLDVDIRFD